MKKGVYERKFPHPLQFAGRSGRNALDASFTLHEAIHYQTERGGKVFSCFLDIEKAYDKIWWDGLLLKLYNLGIRDKLWHLFRNWLLGSWGVVLYDGHLSEPFGITQGIKQGGVLSMFLFTVAVMDIHDYVDQASDGLCVAGMKLGSPAYADDIVLLSNTKSGLTRMMYYMYEYCRQWRLSFSPTKTKCLVFGETRASKSVAKLKRKWKLGEDIIEESESIVHLGITIDAFLNSSIRIKEMCNKGKGIFFSLAHVGVRGHGLNPLTSANIWSKIALPAVTYMYGCELWKINATNMSELERTQKYVAKAIQSFPVRTHDEIARGMIGWHTMESIINNKKLAFLERIIHLSVYTLSKQMLLIRLYEYYFHNEQQKSMMRGYIPDTFAILNQYELIEYMHDYVTGAAFPNKQQWLAVRKVALRAHEIEMWTQRMRVKTDCPLAALVMRGCRPHVLYKLAKNHVQEKSCVRYSAKLITIPKLSQPAVCGTCGQQYLYTPVHIIMDCPSMSEHRNQPWDNIIDILDVEASVDLFHLDDVAILAAMLDGTWNMYRYIDRDTYNAFLIASIRHIAKMVRAYGLML